MSFRGWQAFQNVYEKLNPAQQKAVDTVEGPVLVVAGPGTGKTQVLSARIANILRLTDTNPQNILALTFTESAAKNMQKRLVSMIGKAGYGVHITTFHSFCTGVISSYPEYFPVDRDSQPIADVERFNAFKKLIHELPLDALRPLRTPYFYLKDIARKISELKREGITSDEFATKVVELFDDSHQPEKKVELQKFLKDRQKNQELAIIYDAYQKKLQELQRYDFDDMIAFVVQAFKEEETLLLDYQEKYLYFLVDEYQDTNTAQNEVVNLLASHWEGDANVFVVGDPHQSIYRFQGASTENVIGFTKKYPQAAVITLNQSYRNPQQLSDVAHALIQNSSALQSSSQTPAGKTLMAALAQTPTSTKNNPAAVEVWSSPSQTLELIQVAERITQLLKKGVPAEEIAVLYRNNKDAAELTEILEKWGIYYEIDGGSNVFEFEPIRQLMQLFAVIEQYKISEEDERLFEVLCFPWLHLDTMSVFRLSHLAGRERVSIRSLLEMDFAALESLDKDCLSESQFTALQTFVGKLHAWAVLDTQVVFPNWFETVIEESGFSAWIKQQANMIEIYLYVNTLFEQIKRFCQSKKNFHLSDLLEVVETMREYSISLAVQDLNITEGAVHISTVHKAKGREWSYVFLVHVIDGVWGNTTEREKLRLPSGLLENSATDKLERNDDDRRLLYVAITRAKEQVRISYPETIASDNRVKSTIASMFVHEIQEMHSELATKIDASLNSKQEVYLERLVAPRPVVAFDTEREKFFRKVISNFKLSASSLQLYLRDPKEFILKYILMIPTAKSIYFSFGTAMHAALETMIQQVLRGATIIDRQKVFERFEKALAAEVLTSTDFERNLTHGKKVLEAYMDDLQLETVKPWQLELKFGEGRRTALLDDIVLVGRIDRLDWLDKNKKLLRVIDYKTGSSKSWNVLAGKTLVPEASQRERELPESIRSQYKRQLLFYKLLAHLDNSFDATVTDGVFEFVEPDKKTGKIIKHSFDLPESEVAELAELIKTVMKELRELKFLEFLPTITSTVAEQSKQS